jgi:hypothetical protein
MSKNDFDFQEQNENINEDKPRVVQRYLNNSYIDEEEDERQS